MTTQNVTRGELDDAPGAAMDRARKGETLVITNRGTPEAVMIAVAEFEALREAREQLEWQRSTQG